MSHHSFIARNLAAALLSGAWSKASMAQRLADACGGRQRWMSGLISAIRKEFSRPYGRRHQERVAAFIEQNRSFENAYIDYAHDLNWGSQRIFWVTPEMLPAPGPAKSWQVPALPTSTALARWLGIETPQLDWFADCNGFQSRETDGPLRHYTYRWIPKRTGKYRLLEVPKARLKNIQRQILDDILDRIPSHDCAHGFRKGRSIATFTAPHCGQKIVIRFDLRSFFPTVRKSRIHALFRTAGYPIEVARLLTGLCTSAVPSTVLQSRPGEKGNVSVIQEDQLFRVPHLPQGSPTSPALANLSAYRLDCRLHRLAQHFEGRYTRYADDLAFSGGVNLERARRWLEIKVCQIALEEGFELHLRKSSFMRQGVRQQLVGVVVNAHPNLRRDEYDRLKAILFNCVRSGPTPQNREGHPDFRLHLLGRIAHLTMLNPQRGEKLKKVFEKIEWPAAGS